MIKINGIQLLQTVDEPDAVSPKTIAKIKRDIDRGFKRFCERRGIDPAGEGFIAEQMSGAIAAITSEDSNG